MTAPAWLSRVIHLQRSLVSPGFDETLDAIAAEAGDGFVRHAFPCGTEAYTWVVPPRWTVRAARITANGVTVVDAAHHPLHLVTHSAPFSGQVTRDELLAHVHTDPARPDVIPYVYRFYSRTWGFCLPHAWLDRFTADTYEVVVDTELSEEGALTVGEVVVPGRSPRSLLLSAHLDHPGQFEDGLSGVVGLLEVLRRRRQRATTPFFTLRLLFTCETLGAICYLSRFEQEIKKRVEGCIAPEALCNAEPLRFGHSFGGESQLDRAAGAVFGERFGVEGLPFLDLLSNDDQVFDGPDVFIPSLSIARSPYPEYHSNLDDLSLFHAGRFAESIDTIESILDLLDRNVRPEPRYRSLPFLSRFGIWPDWFGDSELRKRLEVFLRRLDGTRSIVDLCHESRLPLARVEELLSLMERAGLVTLTGDPVPVSSSRSTAT